MSRDSQTPATVDVIRYETGTGADYRAVNAGRGEAVVAAHQAEARKRRLVRYGAAAVVALLAFGYGVIIWESVVRGVLYAGAVVGVAAYYRRYRDTRSPVPELVAEDVDTDRAVDEYDINTRLLATPGTERPEREH